MNKSNPCNRRWTRMGGDERRIATADGRGWVGMNAGGGVRFFGKSPKHKVCCSVLKFADKKRNTDANRPENRPVPLSLLYYRR